MGNEEPSGQQAVEPALVCGCGWEGSYADLNETAEGMTCPKCRLSRNMDCAATLATPPTPSASFRDRLEELAQDWSNRKYNYPSDRASDEEYARNEGKEDAYQDAAIDLCRLLKEPETSPPWQDQAKSQAHEKAQFKIWAEGKFEHIAEHMRWVTISIAEEGWMARAALAAQEGGGERVGENGWLPIETMPLNTPGYLGRWNANNDGHMWWSQSGVERRFRLSDGSEHWSYGDQPPLYGEPATHWHPALLPPAKPCLGRAVAASQEQRRG